MAKLSSMFQQAERSTYVVEALQLNSQQPLLMDAAQLTALTRCEPERWGRILRDLKAAR